MYDTECIWSQAYERLKAYGEEESMLDGPVVVKDNALAGTSAWANTFLGRDHLARQDDMRGRETLNALGSIWQIIWQKRDVHVRQRRVSTKEETRT